MFVFMHGYVYIFICFVLIVTPVWHSYSHNKRLDAYTASRTFIFVVVLRTHRHRCHFQYKLYCCVCVASMPSQHTVSLFVMICINLWHSHKVRANSAFFEKFKSVSNCMRNLIASARARLCVFMYARIRFHQTEDAHSFDLRCTGTHKCARVAARAKRKPWANVKNAKNTCSRHLAVHRRHFNVDGNTHIIRSVLWQLPFICVPFEVSDTFFARDACNNVVCHDRRASYA